MKSFAILFVAALIPFTSFASTTSCPKGTKLVHDCKSTPKKGDSEVTAGMLDSVLVCEGSKKTALVLTKEGAGSQAVKAEKIEAMGGTSYSALVEEGLSVSFNIGFGARMVPHYSLRTTVAGIDGDSTYTCD